MIARDTLLRLLVATALLGFLTAAAVGQPGTAAAESSVAALDPLPTLVEGQGSTATAVARLTTGSGAPVVGARLWLTIDGVPAGSGATDVDGTARIQFRREMAAGDHKAEVRFEATKSAGPSSAARAFTVLPKEASVLALDPLPALKAGQVSTAAVVARLTSASGVPVPGGRLELFVDDAAAGASTTDVEGTAQLKLRRELLAGDHKAEVRFEGTRSLGPSTATRSFTLLTGEVATVLSVDPLPELMVGQPSTVAVLARLRSDAGDPVPGARLQLLVDGAPAGGGATGADGTARIPFRRQLPAGEHQVEVRFEGTGSAAASGATASLSVLPAQSTVLTVDPLPELKVGQDSTVAVAARLTSAGGDPLPGARLQLLVDGAPERSGATGADGTARIPFRRQLPAGEHQVEVRFEGTPSAAASGATGTLVVQPASVPGLVVEPLPALQVGQQDPTITVVAQLRSDTGAPVPGARLQLSVDGTSAGSGFTGADGAAQLRFRRDLVAGQHTVEVRFDGTRDAAAATAARSFTVRPVAGSGLTVEPLTAREAGQDPVTTVVAHLRAATGEPVPMTRLDVVVDGAPAGSGATDADGTARIQFRRELAPGDHEVEGRFGGTRTVMPASITRPFTVLPAEVEVQVVPPLAGVDIAVNGQVFTSGPDGVARLQMDRVGAYRVEVLSWQSAEPTGTKLEFSRWADEVFTPSRDILIPQTKSLQVGLDASYEVGLAYLDPNGGPVDLERITSATLVSNVGARHRFRPGETQWLPGSRIVRRVGGLEEARLLYSVESVQLEGSNVVNAKEQRFYLSPNLQAPVNLLLFSMRIRGQDAFTGVSVGSGITLKHPDGRVERLPFGPDGQIELTLLPRGQYVATVIGPGISFPHPIALSRHQDARLMILTLYDIAGLFLVLASLAVGLLLIGRPHLVSALRPRAALFPFSAFAKGGRDG